MKTNPVKEKLRRGEPSYGTWLSLGDLYATRVLARMGFDWLTLDIEHSAIDWSQAAMIFAAVADAGCVPLARVPEGSHPYIKRVLDAGAMGIVVPMVDTVDQAKAAIAAAYYPPVGNRSVGGGMHAMNFAAPSGEYYPQADGTFPTPEAHEEAIQQVIAAGKKVKCATGIHAMEPQDARRRAEQGMQFLAVGSDLRMLTQKAEETLAALYPKREKKDLARY